jgi:hypothetical protein
LAYLQRSCIRMTVTEWRRPKTLDMPMCDWTAQELQ